MVHFALVIADAVPGSARRVPHAAEAHDIVGYVSVTVTAPSRPVHRDGSAAQRLAQADWLLFLDGAAAGGIAAEVLRTPDAAHSPALQARAWWHVAYAGLRRGDVEAGARALAQARTLYEAAGDAAGLLCCDDLETFRLRGIGRVDEALALHLRIAACSEVERSALDRYVSHNLRGCTRARLGDTDAMLLDFYHAKEAASACDSPGPTVAALVNLAGCHVDLYNLEEALALARRAWHVAEAAQAWNCAILAAANWMLALEGLGQGGACGEVLALLRRREAELPAELLDQSASLLAIGHLCIDDLDGARRWLQRSTGHAFGNGDGATALARARACCELAEGRAAEARRVAEAHIALLDEAGSTESPYARMRLLQVATAACEQMGDDTAALRHLRRSFGLLETLVVRGSRAGVIALQVSYETRRAREAQEHAEGDRERLAALNAQLQDRMAESQRLNAALQAKMAEAHALQQRLQEQALRDPLTGLHNRRFLAQVIDGRLARARRTGDGLAVALLDIDHFKRVNDRHGHEAGDQVLVGFARQLQQRLRSSDILCRFGGEEFLLLLDPCDQGAVAPLMAQWLDDFRAASFPGAAGPFTGCTFSAGVAFLGRDASSFEALVRVADARLYRAKEAGRARACTG